MKTWIPCLVYLLFSLYFAAASDSATAGVDSGCMELADPRDAGLPTPPGGGPQVVCASFFPFAVVMDGSETSRAEVRVVGSGITAVSLGNNFRAVVGVEIDGVAFPQTGGLITLFDDGTHGDRVAGDGVWSRAGISVDAIPTPPIRFSDFDLVRVTDASGTRDLNISSASNNGHYGPARLGNLDPALVASPVSLAPGVSTTDHVAFLVDADLHAELRWLLHARPPTAQITDVTQGFYDHFADRFDFIVLMPGADVPGRLAGALLTASNDVSGIGRPIVDNTALWGSAGRLQTVLPMDLSDGGPLIHELTHRWGVSLTGPMDFQQCSGAHWGVAGVGRSPVGGFDATGLVDNGDGTFSVPVEDFTIGGAPADTTAFNPLDLYLAGLIPASEVPDFVVPVNVDCASISQNFVTGLTTFAADGLETWSIADVIAANGPRVPDVASSQKHFDMAWVVAMNRPPTPTEAGWFEYRSEYIARREPGDQAFRLTFWEATGGRATLSTRLVRDDPIFLDRFEP